MFLDWVTCRDTRHTTQQDGQTEEQTEAEDDVQYAGMDFSIQREKTVRKPKTEKGETLYSDVAIFGWE
ncbi:hypothetical protein PHYPO_G00219130 [Pangasianodon hypophthalmus]|uniref:Uncharacterized protein n=1 Tax=Pangasianodon hypophthalmus TaxID=310915 RepID=A0A5N5NVW8_PANHP|nr:hypothetical protein PHYPO_G00219130 [Pangasianodon hypophthalmus]